MLIDWFTVCAQAINFLILVWLMKHFLYKPVLAAIDAREKLIAGELSDAAAKKKEAQKDRDDFQHKNTEFDHQRAGLLSKATDEAKVERQRLLDEANVAADALSNKRQQSLNTEARNLNQAITRRTQTEVFDIARKTLGDLAGVGLEERMVDVFNARVREMNGKSKESMKSALTSASEPAVVRSTFALPDKQRVSIQKAINETFSADIQLRFEMAPDLISGIELVSKGEKVAWNIEDYLTSLEKRVEELLKQKDVPHNKNVKKADPEPEATKP